MTMYRVENGFTYLTGIHKMAKAKSVPFNQGTVMIAKSGQHDMQAAGNGIDNEIEEVMTILPRD